MTEIDLKSIILKDKDSMHIDTVHRRLILIAFIRTNFNAKDAYELNCGGTYYTYQAYDKLWRRHFNMGMKELKENFKKQFGYTENRHGKLVKIGKHGKN